MAKTKRLQDTKSGKRASKGKRVNRMIDELRQYIVREGITQTEFAERAGVKQSTISRILNGHQSPTVETVDKLAQVMGRDVSELVYLYLGREIPTNMYAIAGRVSALSDGAQGKLDSYLTFLHEQEEGEEHQEPVKRQSE